MLGVKQHVGLAHMPCQSSLISLLPQASKVSFWFNAKLSKCVRHAKEKEKNKKRKKRKRKGHSALSGKLK